MRAALKRDGKRIMAKIQRDDGPIRIGTCSRYSGDYEVKITQWFNPPYQMWWVLNRIRTSMYCDASTTLRCSLYDSLTRNPLPHWSVFWIRHNEPKVVFCDNIITGKNMRLLDLDGNILAGSNIWDTTLREGTLCLGEDVNVLSVHPVEALITNTANRDLMWVGERIEGKLIDQELEVELWPIWKPFTKIPQQILGDLSAWSPS